MRAFAILLVIASVACNRDHGSAAVQKDPDEKKGSSPAALVIRKKPPVVGMRVRETEHFDLTFAFAIGATKHTTSRSQSDTRLEEVLELDGKRVRKLRVTYEARTDDDTSPGAAKTTKPSPVGKSYLLVENSGGAVTVTDAAGKTPHGDGKLKISAKREYL